MRRARLTLVAALFAVGAAASEPPPFRLDFLPTSLGGEWLFRTGHDPAWSSPFRERHAWQPIRVPGCWQKGAPGSKGHAWYVARLFVPSQLADVNLALDLGVVADSDEVFLNGRLIGGRGAFPPRPAASVRTPRLYPLPRISLRYGELNELVVHAYSAAGCGGLLGPAPRIDRYHRLLRGHVQRDLLLCSGAAILLTLAALNILLFATHRDDHAYLLFAVLLIMASVFFLTQTHWGPGTWLGESNLYRVHIAALLGCSATAISVLYRHLQTTVPVPLITLQAALVLGIGFSAVWGAPEDLAVLGYAAQGVLLLLGPYFVSRFASQARQRRHFARLILAVTLLLASTIAIDVFTQVGVLPRRGGVVGDNLSLLGVLPFALAFTVAFFQRWAQHRWGEPSDAAGGVLSQAKFLQRVEVEIERARRTGSTFAIALLRLSAVGESVRLNDFSDQASYALRRTLRQIDALALVRKHTFALLLADTDERAAVLTVERLRATALDLFPQGDLRVGIAAGVVEYRRRRHHLAQEFVAEAEAALHAATLEGPNATATTP